MGCGLLWVAVDWVLGRSLLHTKKSKSNDVCATAPVKLPKAAGRTQRRTKPAAGYFVIPFDSSWIVGLPRTSDTRYLLRPLMCCAFQDLSCVLCVNLGKLFLQSIHGFLPRGRCLFVLLYRRGVKFAERVVAPCEVEGAPPSPCVIPTLSCSSTRRLL